MTTRDHGNGGLAVCQRAWFVGVRCSLLGLLFLECLEGSGFGDNLADVRKARILRKLSLKVPPATECRKRSDTCHHNGVTDDSVGRTVLSV